MRNTITVEERMESEAEFGFFYYYGKLTKKKANELSSLGFTVTDSHESKSYPRLFKVSWLDVELEDCGLDIDTLNEKDEKYTLAQKLWIISTKAMSHDL